jgi:hypothetical protein
VYGFEQQFGDTIQFIWLDVDDPTTLPLREHFDIVRRTRYVLVNGEGEVVQRWIGYLNEPEVEEALEAFIAQQL